MTAVENSKNNLIEIQISQGLRRLDVSISVRLFSLGASHNVWLGEVPHGQLFVFVCFFVLLGDGCIVAFFYYMVRDLKTAR